MAERRMFSKKIINSARFLKMPATSQLLYFYLGLNADDDGVVEAYNILRMTGLSEDDIKILCIKEFVVCLNSDLVVFLKDWREHNKLRADRKVDSIYKDLIIQMVPEADLLPKKTRADVKSNTNIPMLTNGRPVDDNGLSLDGLGQDSTGKDRIGKVRIGKDSTTEDNEAIKLISSKFNFNDNHILNILALIKRNYPNRDVVVVVNEKIDLILSRSYDNPEGAFIQAIRDDWRPSIVNEVDINGYGNYTSNNSKRLRGYNVLGQYDDIDKQLLGWYNKDN